MTDCDVDATLSELQLQKLPVPAVDCQLKPTKIPVPIDVFRPFTNRRYKPCLLVAKAGSSSLSNLCCNDSGVQLDCSIDSQESTVRLSNSTPELKCVNSGDKLKMISSQLELDIAEQTTLRQLQRTVAEMEADVQLHAEALEVEVQQEAQREAVGEIVSQLLDDVVAAPTDAAAGCSTGAVGLASPRRLVRLDDLLQARSNIDPLLKLLLQQSSEHAGDADTEPPPDKEALARAERQLSQELAVNVVTKKPLGFMCSLLQYVYMRIISKFCCPLLFCSLVVGLTYYFRKH